MRLDFAGVVAVREQLASIARRLALVAGIALVSTGCEVEANDPARSMPVVDAGNTERDASEAVGRVDRGVPPVADVGVAAPEPPGSGGAGSTSPPAVCDDGLRRVSRDRPCGDVVDPCGLRSGFPGDEFCLLPPKQGEGIQIRVGPESYDEPGEYLVKPEDEFVRSVFVHLPVDEEILVSQVTVQLRPSAHAWAVSVLPDRAPEGIMIGGGCGAQEFGAVLARGQSLVLDNPPMGVSAPENAGLATHRIPAGSSLCVAFHGSNLMAEDVVHEMWINLRLTTDANVHKDMGQIAVLWLGSRVLPGERARLNFTGRFTGAGRITQLYGFYKKHTEQLSVWLNDRLVYQSFDRLYEGPTPLAPPVFDYDSITMNQAPDAANMRSGAASGAVEYREGDALRAECVVHNDTDSVSVALAETVNSSLCALFGTTLGPGLESQVTPTEASAPIDD